MSSNKSNQSTPICAWVLMLTFAVFARHSYGQAGDLLYLAAIRGDVEITSRATENGGFSRIYINVKNKTGNTLNLALLGSYFAPLHNSPATDSQRLAPVHVVHEEFIGFNDFDPEYGLRLGIQLIGTDKLVRRVQMSLSDSLRSKLMISLAPYGNWKGRATAFCIDPHNPSPGAMENYRLVPSALPEAIKLELLDWVKNPATPQGEIQRKVWSTIDSSRLIFYDPVLADSKTLRQWIRGSRSERDGAELILISSKPGYWGQSLLLQWEQGLSGERARANRVATVWDERGWLTDAQVTTVREWMMRSQRFREMAAMALRTSAPSRWPQRTLEPWMEKSSSEQDLAEGVFIAWGEERGGTASAEEIRLLSRWVTGVPSDRARAERVFERSRPTYWPESIVAPWQDMLGESSRARRVLQIWRSENSRKSAIQIANEEAENTI